MTAETTTIEQSHLIAASPVEVYRAYVDPRRHAEIIGSGATGEPVVGGRFSAWDGYISGRYLELDEPRRIVQSWSTTEWAPGVEASRLELNFDEEEGMTRLRMVHSQVPAELSEALRQGWIDHYWSLFQSHFGRPS